MIRLHLYPLPRPSRSAPPSPKKNTHHSVFPNSLYRLPPTPTGPNGGTASIALIDESESGLASLLRATDQFSENEDEEIKSKSSFTFCHDGDGEKPSMAFADELFRNGFLVPLRPPPLKLPPRLQATGEGTSQHTELVSPKSSGSQRGFAKGKGKDFDPLGAALERIRKEDGSLRETFHWRSLEQSFERSFGRVLDEEVEESGWRSRNDWWTLEEDAGEKRAYKRRGNHWNPLSCFLSYA